MKVSKEVLEARVRKIFRELLEKEPTWTLENGGPEKVLEIYKSRYSIKPIDNIT